MNEEQAIAKALKLIPEYIAQDEDCSWWGYYENPLLSKFHNNWTPVHQGKCIRLSKPTLKSNPDWKNSLRKVTK